MSQAQELVAEERSAFALDDIHQLSAHSGLGPGQEARDTAAEKTKAELDSAGPEPVSCTCHAGSLGQERAVGPPAAVLPRSGTLSSFLLSLRNVALPLAGLPPGSCACLFTQAVSSECHKVRTPVPGQDSKHGSCTSGVGRGVLDAKVPMLFVLET